MCGTNLLLIYPESIPYSFLLLERSLFSSRYLHWGAHCGLSKSILMVTVPLPGHCLIMGFSQLWPMRCEEKSARCFLGQNDSRKYLRIKSLFLPQDNVMSFMAVYVCMYMCVCVCIYVCACIYHFARPQNACCFHIL